MKNIKAKNLKNWPNVDMQIHNSLNSIYCYTKSFKRDQDHLHQHITWGFILKTSLNIYKCKHLFTCWIQEDIKSGGNSIWTQRTCLENIYSRWLHKVALLLFEGVCSCTTLKQPVAVVTDGTLKHLQYFTWDCALLREGIAWSLAWNKAVIYLFLLLFIKFSI